MKKISNWTDSPGLRSGFRLRGDLLPVRLFLVIHGVILKLEGVDHTNL